MLTDQDSRDPLHWLSRILWPDESTTICVDGPTDPRWWASPNTANPKILVPVQSGAAARTAVRRYHDGFDLKLRARSAVAEVLAPLSPLVAAPLRRKQVAAHHQRSPEPGVLEGIADLMGIDDLHVAVSLSTPKSNQKPVLQLLDGSGRCHGWAKVAWNDRTEALVANEARWVSGTAIAPLSKPNLLHDVALAGRRVVISSSVTPSRIPRRRSGKPPSAELFKAVSALGTTETVRLKESAWWLSVESVLEHATSRERLAVQAAVDSCYGNEIRVGAWHGDLTPWNMMSASGRIHVIDWEFAADGVPVGFDLCHFHTQVGSEMRNLDAAGALDHSARLSSHGLATLGIEPENRTAVWRMYLVELIRRMVALRASGYPPEQITHGPAALNRLERSQGAILSSIKSTVAAPMTGEPQVAQARPELPQSAPSLSGPSQSAPSSPSGPSQSGPSPSALSRSTPPESTPPQPTPPSEPVVGSVPEAVVPPEPIAAPEPPDRRETIVGNGVDVL